MKNIFFSILILSTAVVVLSCKREKHFLKEEVYRKQIQEQFEERKSEVQNRSHALFSVFENEDLTLEQREALQFLYACMPLSDLADYDGYFFLKQIDAAFRARDYFSWTKTIPDDVFRHFVLVYRVNNEYLDTARIVFFEELKDRIKNLSMYEAALEVNHWCHEKVTYKGTDARTSAPLDLVRTSWGRCGEESTFTVAALRSVGIPARQCYTPRWVHTDDNHAWVEVWIDGQWHYMGACEPEPELDLAWFTAPAKRTMMVHTTVFGLYTGKEEKNVETPWYSKINLLENYAETRKVNVQVLDDDDQPVEGAKVKFKVYNYAEFYTIAETITGKDGKTSIVSGKGNLMIWASKGDYFGYGISEAKNDVTLIGLEYTAKIRPAEEDFLMEVPLEKAIKEISPEKLAANIIRLAQEDSIRNAYMNTFIKEEEARLLARQYQLNPEEVWKYLNLSQGNWREIKNFIIGKKDHPYLFPFLASLAEKDLRDVSAACLNDHLPDRNDLQIKSGTPDEMIVTCILSPRIEWEMIKPWRSYIREQIGTERTEEFQNNVNIVIDYVKKNIKINDEENYYNCRISPQGVYELKVADKLSRDVFFVAFCRSFGIPARIESSTMKPQYFEDGQWIDVIFQTNESLNLPKAARLTVENNPDNLIKPIYYAHYTLAYFKDGDFHTLDFENNPIVSHFPYTLQLDEGYYRLTVGSRLSDGSVCVRTEYFTLKENTLTQINVSFPKTREKLLVKGIVDMNLTVTLKNGDKISLKKLSKGKGLTLCFLDMGKEPSKHVLQDLSTVKNRFDIWGGGTLFLTADDKSNNTDISIFKDLPQNTNWGVDHHRELLNLVTGVLQMDFNNNFPLTLYLTRNGGILYSTAGYHIGTGEDLLEIIVKEEKSTPSF
ncbi:MAG: transglutaminase-like domain-containing protein [Bacteroidales bacterium]|jgi:transglutaminase-like putative cysteine protease|nr:transglutaminase-like domain-containing protein [Bacteroidales bacterium]